MKNLRILFLLLTCSAAIMRADNAQDLMQAIKKDDIQTVRDLLEKGVDANSRDEHGSHALLLSSGLGNLEITKMLIEKQADVNEEEDEFDFTALMVACMFGHAEIVKLLIDNGANINAENAVGSTALTFTACKIFTDLSSKVDKKFRNFNLYDENSAEHTLQLMSHNSKNGHVEIANLLIKNGAEVDTQCMFGITPLMIASLFGDIEMVNCFIENGANVNNESMFGITPLMCASCSCLASASQHISTLSTHYTKIAQLLIDNGLNIEEGNKSFGAAISKFAGMEQYFNEASIAYSEWLDNYPKVVKFLIDNGADVNAQAGAGSILINPLMLACISGDIEIVKTLINSNVNVNDLNHLYNEIKNEFDFNDNCSDYSDFDDDQN